MAGIVRQIALVAALAAAGYGGWRHWGAPVAATAGAAGPGAQRPAPGVVVAAARRDRVERTVSAVGTGRPLRAVELATLSDGRVVEVGFEGGEAVAAGAVLLRLDDAEARADLAEAEAERVRAAAAFERARTLQAQGRVADTAFETAEAELRVAEARLDRARKALDDRTLRAPFDGMAGFRMVDVGAVIDGSATVGKLEDISALDVDFAVPERFYGEVAVGAAVRATSETNPGRVFEGVLTGVGRSVDVVSRSFTARARIDNPGLILPAGAFMRVTLVLEAREGVTAPEEAVVAENGETFVYVVADDRAERRRVRVGERVAGRAEIVEGLAAGERVVTRGVQKVGDGRPVRVLSDEGAPAAAAAPGA
jgi:membrane fusion protein (multidrug efflux system)